jgi:hypothetical protein
MNAILVEKPSFPGVSTDRDFARLSLRGIAAASSESSTRLNHYVAAVAPSENEKANFDPFLWPETEDEIWTEAKNQRRCHLIDRKYAQGITPRETRELARLQALMLRHSRRVAPLPIDDARRLYQELLAAVAASRSPTDP